MNYLSSHGHQPNSERNVGRPKAIIGIIKINLIIFLFWQFFVLTWPVFMIQNFLVSWASITDGRIWTLLTAVFSHNMFFHLFINMYVLFGFGMILENVLGSKTFLKFYLATGIVSSLSHSLVCLLILKQPQLPALGASGAISAVVMVFALLFPKQKIYILGIIPVPALTGVLIFSGLDLWGLISQARGLALPIGYGAHLGGVVSGAIYFFFHFKKRPVGNQREGVTLP